MICRLIIFLIKELMEVHLCTFQITLHSVKVSGFLTRKTLQALWRTQKGDPIIIGAVKPTPRRAIALFSQNFQIKTDLLRDPHSGLYLPSIILLQIRGAGQSTNQSVSSSISKFDLSDILNHGHFLQKAFASEESTFDAVLSMRCSELEDTGVRRNKKKSSKRGKSSEGVQEQKVQEVEGKGKSRPKRSGSQKIERDKAKDQQRQIANIQSQLQRQQAQHILTQQRFREAEASISDYENVINQLSATVTQRDTSIIEISQKFQQNITKIKEIQAENTNLKQQLSHIKYQSVRQVQEQRNQKVKLVDRVKELENTLEKVNQNFGRKIKNQNHLQNYSEQLQEENRVLTKQIDQLRNTIIEGQWQRQAFRTQLKKSQDQKQEMKRSVGQWKQQFSQEYKLKDSQLRQSQQQYIKVFQLYSQATQRLKLIGQHVPRHEIVQLQQIYEQKVRQYQQKQGALKQQVDNIEQDMIELEDMLEQKEGNEEMLIDHVRQLQLQIQTLKGEHGWWKGVIQNGLGLKDQEELLRGSIEQGINGIHNTQDQKIKQLLTILQSNSKHILDSVKNKHTIQRYQRRQEELTQRASITNEELQQVKQRLAVIIKENKKLLEKSNKTNRSLDAASRNNKKLQEQVERLNKMLKEEKDQNQQLTFRLKICERDLRDLELITTAKRGEERVEKNVLEKIAALSTPMPIISQDNDELAVSIPIPAFDSQSAEPPKAVIELASLLSKRTTMHDQLLTHNTSIKETHHEQKQLIYEQFRHVRVLSSKLKTVLVRAGQKQAVKDWQLALERLSSQIEGLLTVA